MTVTTRKQGNKWGYEVSTPVGSAFSSTDYDTEEAARKAGEAEEKALIQRGTATT